MEILIVIIVLGWLSSKFESKEDKVKREKYQTYLENHPDSMDVLIG